MFQAVLIVSGETSIGLDKDIWVFEDVVILILFFDPFDYPNLRYPKSCSPHKKFSRKEILMCMEATTIKQSFM